MVWTSDWLCPAAAILTPSLLPSCAQGLYSQVTKYLELKNRVAVLNARYQVLEAMLLMVQQQLNEAHAVRLELIIIVLIGIEIGLGLAELWLLQTGALGH